MNRFELWVLRYTGTIIAALGVFCAGITLYLDVIRVRPVEFGWLQLAGIILFAATAFFGSFVNIFLHSVKDMLEKYLDN